MAAGLLERALETHEESWARSYTVISSGIAAVAGQPASPYAIQAMEKIGIDLKDHRSQPVSDPIIRQSALTLCMTQGHKRFIRQCFLYLNTPILLMRELIPETEDKQIADPFGLDILAYEACRDKIAEVIPAILEFLQKYHSCPA